MKPPFPFGKIRVGLNPGREFGLGGEAFVRLIFDCPRATLMEALLRIKAAVRQSSSSKTGE